MSDLLAAGTASALPPAEAVIELVLGRALLLWVWGRRGIGRGRMVVVVEEGELQGLTVALLSYSLY